MISCKQNSAINFVVMGKTNILWKWQQCFRLQHTTPGQLNWYTRLRAITGLYNNYQWHKFPGENVHIISQSGRKTRSMLDLCEGRTLVTVPWWFMEDVGEMRTSLSQLHSMYGSTPLMESTSVNPDLFARFLFLLIFVKTGGCEIKNFS